MKNYSFSMGEITPDFEWYEYGQKTETGQQKYRASKLTVAKLLSAALVVSYLSGGIIYGNDILEGERENTEEPSYGAAVPAMSDGISLYESEREARIDELADAYIEAYMSEKYGERGASE